MRWPIFLFLALLSFQVGTRINICLMADGGVHIIQHHTPCDPAESGLAIDSLASDDHHLDDRHGCLDIAIDEGASANQQKNFNHPAPAIAPLGETITCPQTAQHLLRTTPPDLSPQLLPLRSVVILRV